MCLGLAQGLLFEKNQYEGAVQGNGINDATKQVD